MNSFTDKKPGKDELEGQGGMAAPIMSDSWRKAQLAGELKTFLPS